MIVLPLSREYPIEVEISKPQESVVATRRNGEVTSAPLVGDLTVMADAVAEVPKRAKKA
jgi:hypothetical protein